MEYVKNLDWLRVNLENKSVRIIDCRFDLQSPDKGEKWYEEGHIPSSVYFHLEKDLSNPVREHGGRHPLPDIEELVKKLENIGVDKDTIVIAYDNGEGAFAGRCWWLLNYIGHSNTYILDGGYKEWIKKGYPTTRETLTFSKSSFSPIIQSHMAATYQEISLQVQTKGQDKVLIDSREYKRYTGEMEPIDKKSGHIPGAENFVWTEGLKNGYFLSIDDQKERFSSLKPDKEYIVYCGSGITAIPNYISLKMAGFDKVKLYPGSFSDWISYEENEVETCLPSQLEK
ncbi:sulfurtransferase [Niallia sp.]|uniref:sulfurtransferase n=1 Tax=Niallia sp. TaxID=2837523 RepID=UPI00289F4766|nr:sulfurtransferase [Niallia sp.]